ncbi:gastrula zinc finger protein XlCGF53.1-like isoform X7 [Pecten maximus]|uniref:gastrula zinc finger protein XlCGF53.1-like isoform X7 n=1 Tax=Pecten maximus TaxID=6579 RepID=UPI0014588124|nr:gastrula zinc finger protein XlCGF53.1-like isoform X7 [Pecten maximus]
MRSLGGKVQESTFCDILHNAVLQVCREKYWADSPDWEVDGVICISVPHSQEQHVVKIHQKFPSDSGKHFDNRCFECDRKPKDALSTNETSERHFNESVEEDDSSYRNVSVIDLEHASTQPNPAQTCGQGTIPPSLPSPVREQNSHNFYASPDLSGFGPNVHRQKSEQLKNSSGQSHSKTNNRSKDQEHSSSFTSHPRETTPPRKKSKTEPEEYVVVKAEPDDDEDFALHMECIDEKESDNTAEIKDENIQRDLAAETQEDINFLLNVEGPSASHQFNSGDRSWGQRLPTSTVTSQMDTNLSSMAGQGSQGFSNLNLLTHGVDIEDGTMRLTTRVQHPSFIAGQTDSNTPEQRTIPRPSGQDSAAASNAIGQFYDLCRHAIERQEETRDHVLPRMPSIGTPNVFRCDICTYTTNVKYRMTRHQKIHSGDYLKCDMCSAKFTEPCELRAHRQSRHEGISVACPLCGKLFPSKHSLSNHRAQQHPKKTFTCTFCKDRSFVKLGNLQHHIATFHKP